MNTIRGIEFFSAALFFLLVWQSHACTIGTANGNATSDGRPILWKNRDIAQAQQRLSFFPGQPFSYLAVHSAENDANMGMNEKGVAASSSFVRSEGNETTRLRSPDLHRHILRNFSAMPEIRAYLQELLKSNLNP